MATTRFQKLSGRLQEGLARHPALSLYLRAAVLLALFLLVNGFMKRVGNLTDEAYRQPYLVFELLRGMGLFVVAGALTLAVLLGAFGKLAGSWFGLDHGARLRCFVVFLAALMAWPFSLYGYNFYFDQGHYTDRAMLLLLLPLLWWRPMFIFPFLALAYTVMGQLAEPGLGGSVFAHKLQVLKVLNLFAAMFLVHAVTGSRKVDTFLLLCCCLVAASYWLPALAKLKLNWLAHGQLYLAPLAAYAHGWLSFAEPATLVKGASLLAWFDWPMRVFVLVIEAGFLLFLLRRSLSLLLLAAAMLFHLGVFALYGFLFWTWLLLDLALFALLWSDRHGRKFPLYGTSYLLLSVVLILAANYWAKPPSLGWYDTRLSYTYRIHGETASGYRYRLPPVFFAPYEDFFTMATFSYLVEGRGVLVAPYGVTSNATIATALQNVDSARQVFALEEHMGAKKHNAARAERLRNFLREYVRNRNATANPPSLWEGRLFPPQFWSSIDTDVFQEREPLVRLSITEVTTLYDGRALKVIREQELETIDVNE